MMPHVALADTDLVLIDANDNGILSGEDCRLRCDGVRTRRSLWSLHGICMFPSPRTFRSIFLILNTT